MYTIDIRLKADDWKKVIFDTQAEYVLIAHIVALQEARRKIGIKDVEFLPLGNMEYVIWAEKACQGFLAIIDNGPLPLTEDEYVGV